MSWHYVPTRRTVAGEEIWEIREYYPGDKEENGDGDGDLWTAVAMEPSGYSWQELAADLTMMLTDVFSRQFLDLDADPPVLRDRPEETEPIRSIDLPSANRVEVVETAGRAFVRYYHQPGTAISIQDDGRTVKVFPEQTPLDPELDAALRRGNEQISRESVSSEERRARGEEWLAKLREQAATAGPEDLNAEPDAW